MGPLAAWRIAEGDWTGIWQSVLVDLFSGCSRTCRPAFVFRLDDEHRSRISDCVRKGGIQLNHQGITDFACNIESSIVTFLKARADTSGRRRQATMRFATCGNQTN
jgi:hypothetical protein